MTSPSEVVGRLLVTLLLGLAAGLVSVAAPPAAPPAQAYPGTPGAKDVIVHLFEWPWASIASECTNVLGPKGFGGVQVSPPQEHVVLPGQGYPWWQDYQPVSYQLTSRRGDRTAFANMVQTCHNAGVKIYVDAVVNHMAGGGSTGSGSGGSSYSHYGYPAVPYGYDDFHHCGRNGNDDIANWGDRWEIQNCELVDLSDLKTESGYVRGKLAGYLQDLVSLGVDGFRVDAAKHMPVADLSAIYPANRYIYQEVIEGGPGEISPTEYTGIGDVTEFRYGDVAGNAFRDGNLSNLNNLAGSMLLASADAVAFIDNHDTQRNGRAKLTYKDGTNYALAEAFMLAWPYGVPKVMSSFGFSGHDQGPPTSSDGTTTAVSCGNGWVCEHRWRTTSNLVGFRNTASGTGVSNWWSNGSNQIGFGRTGKGYVAFNRASGALSRTFQTDLPAGLYCDVANGDVSGTSCTQNTYQVDSNGQFTATIPANAMLALHVDARVTGCGSVSVNFAVEAYTVWGENVYVVGNRPELGNWSPDNAVPLSAASYPIWRGAVNLPKDTTFEYKYLKKNGSQVIWETGGNRVRNTGSACSATYNDVFRT
ncbi:MAG: carbohydrate-binding module family 20 domain-containing protein [Micromonosporaceae bacterium]